MRWVVGLAFVLGALEGAPRASVSAEVRPAFWRARVLAPVPADELVRAERLECPGGCRSR